MARQRTALIACCAVRVVYFARRVDDGLIKIGFTRDLRQRMQGLSSTEGRHQLLGVVPGDRYLEGELHALFASDRVVREWFRPSDELQTLVGLARRGLSVRPWNGRAAFDYVDRLAATRGLKTARMVARERAARDLAWRSAEVREWRGQLKRAMAGDRWEAHRIRADRRDLLAELERIERRARKLRGLLAEMNFLVQMPLPLPGAVMPGAPDIVTDADAEPSAEIHVLRPEARRA